ncbi:hypothetical protein IC575_023110 [Cucumis melo]
MQYTSHRNLFTLGLPAGSINPSGGKREMRTNDDLREFTQI